MRPQARTCLRSVWGSGVHGDDAIHGANAADDLQAARSAPAAQQSRSAGFQAASAEPAALPPKWGCKLAEGHSGARGQAGRKESSPLALARG